MGKRKVIADEEVYYKVNRAIIKENGKYLLRNTWTGKEKSISKKEALKLANEWEKLRKVI